MNLSTLDWTIVAAYFIFVLAVGLIVSRKAGSSVTEYFLSGRNMAWWILGVSMVATTFSADTPNLVTDLVRKDGVAGNWVWWAFLLTGMLTVFVFAKLWRRSEVLTDIEFYELRYSGKMAAFLRGFRALYLGLIFNVLVTGAVSLAAIKFGEIVLGWDAWLTLLVAGSITIAYSTIGGLKAVVMTDFVQFILAMIGSIWACIYLIGLDEIGGLTQLLAHENVVPKKSMLPDFTDASIWVPIMFVPLAVQWWASYYPGAEPGGGGYIAQRMFSARNEKGAIKATLFFNTAHYALRPWPWILIALASLVIFPELSDIQRVFPNLPEDKLGHDVAYPAMLTMLPPGLLGLVSASLIAAFMSTMSTQLNLGASYLVNDFYHRFFNPTATQSQLVWAGRIFTVVSAFLGLGLGLVLTDAGQAFNYLLLLGAGTGAIYILRWFWWRINAMTEIVAMIASLIIASYFTFSNHGLEGWQTIVIGSVLTTLIWVIATFVTPPTDDETLRSFYQKLKPGGAGWNPVIQKAKQEGIDISSSDGSKLPLELLSVVVACITVYATLFATGHFIYSNFTTGLILAVVALMGMAFIMKTFGQIKVQE